MVVPNFHVGDVVFFSRYTYHRSVPFIDTSMSRMGMTLRLTEGSAVYKSATMNCYPNHMITMYDGEMKDGQRYRESSIFAPMIPGKAYTRQDILNNHRHGLTLMGSAIMATQAVTRGAMCIGAKRLFNLDINVPTVDISVPDEDIQRLCSRPILSSVVQEN
jgi:hypothetical protein